MDYSKLRARMTELHISHEDAAGIIGVTPSTFSYKINNRSEFTSSEINKLIIALRIPLDQMAEYFFNSEVEKTQQGSD